MTTKMQKFNPKNIISLVISSASSTPIFVKRNLYGNFHILFTLVKMVFCYGLKLKDFLNLNHFFVTKVTFKWLLPIMSSRNKREKVNVSSQNLKFLQKNSSRDTVKDSFFKK